VWIWTPVGPAAANGVPVASVALTVPVNVGIARPPASSAFTLTRNRTPVIWDAKTSRPRLVSGPGAPTAMVALSFWTPPLTATRNWMFSAV